MPTAMPPTTMHNLADYFYGSSIEYSPLSSPDSNDISAVHEPQLIDDLTYNHSSMAIPMSIKPPLCDMYYSEAANAIPASTGYHHQSALTTGYQPAATSRYQSTNYQPTTSSHNMTLTLGGGFGAKKEIKMPQSE
jgi:hypothetical protein